jgi:hypothetical protein
VFLDRVVVPTLAALVPIPPDKVGGPRRFLVQIARDNSHNDLCYEARLAFAMTMGAAFERQLRLWLSQAAPDRATEIRKSDFAGLLALLATLRSADFRVAPEAADLIELWLVVNAGRHGAGASAERLFRVNPRLWAHLDPILRKLYFEGGLQVYEMRIEDDDLHRYTRATRAFWERLATVPRRTRVRAG